jgi:hypothetical protein
MFGHFGILQKSFFTSMRVLKFTGELKPTGIVEKIIQNKFPCIYFFLFHVLKYNFGIFNFIIRILYLLFLKI